MLAADAVDLRLPAAAVELPRIETALSGYHDAQIRLIHAARELRVALPDLQRQGVREREARDDPKGREEQHATARIEAEEASARLKVLRETVGARVEELQRQIADARVAVDASDRALERARQALKQSGEERAIAGEQAKTANAVFEQRADARTEAVPARLQRFAATGLLSIAAAAGWTCQAWQAPGRSIPRLRWPAVPNRNYPSSRTTTTRGHACSGRSREDFTELQRALSALGHQVQADQSD